MEEEITLKENIKNFFRVCWRGVFLIVWPLICSPIALINPIPSHLCLFTIAVMAGFWITEVIPGCVTSMIPLCFYPLFQIMDTKDVCMQYFTSVNGTFVNGIFLAFCIEYCNLHMRISLLMIKSFGSSVRRLTFSITIITALVSLWVSNTAATAMMCPIILATVTQLESAGVLTAFYKLDENEPESDLNLKASDITAGFFIIICYAANIGGIGTYLGTPSNLAFLGIHEERFGGKGTISFALFMAITLPIMIVSLLLTWVWLQFVFFGLFRPRSEAAKQLHAADDKKEIIANIVNREYDNLGPMSWHEIWVLIFFITVIFLLITMKPGFMPGWGQFVAGKTLLKDTTPLVGLIILMFCIADKPTCFYSVTKNREKRITSPQDGLVTWKYLQTKTPWSLLFLIGGGVAMSKGIKESKASCLVGNSLKVLKSLPSELIIFISCLAATICTEICFNVPTTNTLLPMINEMAVVMKVNPLKFTYPVTICCSFAFFLPVGTAPNGIIKDFGHVQLYQMFKAGIGANIITLLVTYFSDLTYVNSILHTDLFPDWAAIHTGNLTC